MLYTADSYYLSDKKIIQCLNSKCTIYCELTDDSLIKLTFYPNSSEPQKVWKGFDSAGNAGERGENPPSINLYTSHGCPPVTHMHTPPINITKEDMTEMCFLPKANPQPIDYRLNTLTTKSTDVPSLNLNYSLHPPPQMTNDEKWINLSEAAQH